MSVSHRRGFAEALIYVAVLALVAVMVTAVFDSVSFLQAFTAAWALNVVTSLPDKLI